MPSDWKDILGALRQDPSLPEGEEQPVAEPEQPHLPGPLRVFTDRKGRKGKTATIVEGFGDNEEKAAEAAAMLRRRLGVGGSSRGGEILVQGDLADKVRMLLREQGYKVR